jgi:mRNA interferase MazF
MTQVRRGEIWWADLPEPRGSEPGFRRPVLVIQANAFNRSCTETIVVAVITSNLVLAELPGNVLLARGVSGLSRDSVVNVSQVRYVDRRLLSDRVGRIPPRAQAAVDSGLRLVLGLDRTIS